MNEVYHALCGRDNLRLLWSEKFFVWSSAQGWDGHMLSASFREEGVVVEVRTTEGVKKYMVQYHVL